MLKTEKRFLVADVVCTSLVLFSVTRSTYGKGTFSASAGFPANAYNKAPFFKADITLVIPQVVCHAACS